MKKSFSLLVTGVAMSTFAADPTVRLITLDPGHFHAGLVQKEMYPQVSPVVHVYAPAGPDVTAHLQRIDGFNTRADSPTHWEEKVFTGPDIGGNSSEPGRVDRQALCSVGGCDSESPVAWAEERCGAGGPESVHENRDDPHLAHDGYDLGLRSISKRNCLHVFAVTYWVAKELGSIMGMLGGYFRCCLD